MSGMASNRPMDGIFQENPRRFSRRSRIEKSTNSQISQPRFPKKTKHPQNKHDNYSNIHYIKSFALSVEVAIFQIDFF